MTALLPLHNRLEMAAGKKVPYIVDTTNWERDSDSSNNEDTSYYNLSSLTSSRKLNGVCSRKAECKLLRSSYTAEKHFFKFVGLKTKEDLESYSKWWLELWNGEPAHKEIETFPESLRELAYHVYGTVFCEADMFRNGAGKISAYHLINLARGIPPKVNTLWSVRVSTTTHPVHDWCGLPHVYSSKLPEKRLNGKHEWNHAETACNVMDYVKVGVLNEPHTTPLFNTLPF